MPQIKIIGEANFKQMQMQLAAVTAQAEALNLELAKSSMVPMGGSVRGWQQNAAAMGSATRAYNAALAASGAYRVEQIRVNDLVAQHTDLLNRQKLAFNEVFGRQARTNMRRIYREQMALREMTVRNVSSGVGDGRLTAQLAIPKEVIGTYDTLANRIGMVGYRLSSASRVLLNWGKNTQWAGRQLMTGLTMPVAAFGAAAGVMAYQVDKQLTRVQKVYNTTANANSESIHQQMAAQKELDELRVAGMRTAVNVAKTYGQSVTDTLEVQATLAATGQKGASLQEATTEVMKNAMLGEIDYNVATTATIALQQQLHLSTQQLSESWAYMNSVENETVLGMNDFAQAIPIALGPITQMGGSLQDLGTLMTGMMSRGIQVGKAANAIKALPQRLLRPSKQIQEEFAALTGESIVDIAERNQGRIMGILTDLFELTKDMSDFDAGKIFAGLFGSFQLTNMRAMIESMGDLEAGIGQVTTAQQVGQRTAEQWAQVQQREIKAITESASGRFKRALETIKGELAEAGEPFLEMASVFLTVTAQIIGWFNELPSAAKKVAMVTAIFGALAGPVIMIVGLLANFIANMGLLAGWVLKATTRFNLLNKAEQANNMLMSAANKGFLSAADSTAILTQRIEALTMATRMQAEAWAQATGMPLPANWASVVGQSGPVSTRASEIFATTTHGPAVPGKRGRPFMSDIDRAYATNAILNKEAAAAAEKEAAAKAKTRTHMAGGAVSAGVMAAAMATMAISSGEATTNIAQWALIAAMVVPAAQMLYPAMKSAAVAAWSYAAAHVVAAKASVTSGGVLKGSLTSLIGMGRALMVMIGPIGLIAAGFTALFWFAHKAKQESEEMMKQQLEQQKAINESTATWAETLGYVEESYKSIQAAAMVKPGGENDMQKAIDTFSKSGTGKKILTEYKDSDTWAKETIALQQYMAILRTSGGDISAARQGVEVLFRSAGEGAIEAQMHAQEFFSSLDSGTRAGTNLSDLWKRELDAISRETQSSVITERGKQIGKTLADAIASQKTNAGKIKVFDQFAEVANQKGEESFESFLSGTLQSGNIDNNMTRIMAAELFDRLKIDSFAEAQEFKDDVKAYMDEQLSQTDLLEKWKGLDQGDMLKLDDIADLNFDATASAGIQKVIDSLREQLGIRQSINSMAELEATWQWRLYTVTEKTQEALYEELKARIAAQNAIDVLFGGAKMTAAQIALAAQNSIRLAKGLEPADYLVAGLDDNSYKVKENLEKAKHEAAGLSRNLSFSNENMKSILQTSMEGVMNDISDALSEGFEERRTAAIDAAQRSWDSKADALEASQERRMDRFDAAWERREDAVNEYYEGRMDNIDKTIEKEKKAEEQRKRMFDAEIARLERLAEMANANIDFNMAVRTGDLDEAAKIQNDMTAKVIGWALGDQQEQRSRQSDRRVEGLEGQKDALEEARDQRLEALEKEREDQRKHLEAVQEAQKKSLEEQTEAQMAALNQQWDNSRDHLDDQLELFKSGGARNKKELEKWMKEVGLSYDAFGSDLKGKGDSWSRFFKNSLKKHVREAGQEIATDAMWENWGAKEAKATLLGMGFTSMSKFKNFMKTGELPDDFGAGRKKRDQDTNAGPRPVNTGYGPQGGGSAVHATTSRRNVGNGVGGPTGPSGLVSSIVKGLAVGVGKGLANAFSMQTARNTVAAIFGTTGVRGGAFVAGEGGWHPAGVPGKGWSSSHDYRNGVGSPLYAFNDSTVIESRAIRSGGGTKYAGSHPGEYTSYGETILLQDAHGNTVRYAHLDKGMRFVQAGQVIPGGSLIGLSGWTGNASGPHTHYEWNGSYDARGGFASAGIPLATGAYLDKGGPAILHDKEAVINPTMTEALYAGIDQMNHVWTWLSGMDLGKTLSKMGDTNASTSTGGQETVRTGTYNISWRSPASTTPGAIERLMGLADVLSLQEVYGDRVGLVRDTLAKGGWGMSQYLNDSIVAYNKSKYSLLGSGNRGMNPNAHGGGVHRNRNAAWALLRSGSGAEFYQLSAHTNPMFGQMTAGGHNYSIQREQYGTLSDMVTEFAKRAPVILGGDLNWELERPGGIPIADLVSVLAGKPGGLNGLHTHAGGGDVDHIMFGPGSKNVSSRIVGGFPSDHNALLSELQIPSARKGLENVRWDNTLVNLHAKESVLTADQSEQFRRNLDRFDSARNVAYNAYVTLNGADVDAADVADEVDKIHRRHDRRRPTRRTNRR